MLIRWRFAIVILCWFQIPSLFAQETHSIDSKAPIILVVGDSLSAEYGLQRDTGWVRLLGERLVAQNAAYQIRNASISGDTTSGGISRLPIALSRDAPNIVIIELGSNDALRGLSLDMTENNLAKMIVLSQQAGARVLLLGMQIPPNYGRQYTEQFRQIFVDLAKKYDVALLPFLLDGIATNPGMFQSDGIHPNEKAQLVLEENVWSQLKTLLKP